jgi:hypothetical protein
VPHLVSIHHPTLHLEILLQDGGQPVRPDPCDVPTATQLFALRSVVRRYEALSVEIAELDAHLDRLAAQVAPELVSLPAIDTDHATVQRRGERGGDAQSGRDVFPGTGAVVLRAG